MVRGGIGIVLAVCCLFSGCELPTGGDDHGAEYREDIVLLRSEKDPSITFKVWAKTGSWQDPPGKEGLAWITGQLIEQGATTSNSYEQILEKLYPLASGYSVRVDHEMTVLSGRTHRDNLEPYFALFTDAYLKPAFKESDFQRIRTDTLNYLKNSLRYSQDEELGKAALREIVFEGQSYSHPPQGRVSSVESLELEDVKRFYRSRFTRGNVMLALGGGFDAELVDRFRATLADLPAAAEELDAAVPPAAPEFEGRHALLVDKPGADASISFGFPIDVRRGSREFYALWVANSWMGEHRNSSSHLFQVIREKRGLNYGDYSYIEAFPGGGRRSFPPTHVGRSRQLFEIWIRTLPNDKAVFALRAAMRELDRLVKDGMRPADFELTRDFLTKYVLHFAPSTADRLGYAVDDVFYGLTDEGHLDRFRRILPTLTLEEVNAAVRTHLEPKRMKIAIVTGEAERIRTELGGDRPTPIEYGRDMPSELLEEDGLIAGWPIGVEPSKIRVTALDEMFR